MTKKQVFVIQCSGKSAKHITVAFRDRTYANEVSRHGYYRHESWDSKPRDQQFGKVRIGDYILQYCTNDVESCPGQIRNIYEVTKVEKIGDDIKTALEKKRITREKAAQLGKSPHVIRLKPHLTLNRGLELPLIREWVRTGRLSPSMKNCGGRGFNICEVDWEDYETMVDWNRTQPSEPSIAWGAMLEERLRRYIADSPTLSPIFGDKYESYRLRREPDGRVTGELYDTKTVGEIDLLYQNEVGDLLVVELKRTQDTADKAMGQIGRYLGWVRQNLAGTKKVEGILVARSASEELRYAINALENCRLFTYEILFRFSAPD